MKFTIEQGDYVTAGEASRKIKRNLRKIGIDKKIIRRVAIAAYEGEMNVAIHSLGGEMGVELLPDKVVVVIQDKGPGIPDLDLAMKEGWSTAGKEVREMGFGAGMGLPNMEKNADEFQIKSGSSGTTISMGFNVN
jgi:anti-sigma regulatory factor (Ser/Thr protein kinase)